MGIEASRSRGTRSLFKCDPHSCWNVKPAFKDVDVYIFLAFLYTYIAICLKNVRLCTQRPN